MSSLPTQLSDAALRTHAPYLKIDAVQAGDVLLTRGRAARSQFIAAVTGGEYSHASLWVPLSEGLMPTLIEADGLGVGFSTLAQFFFSVPGSDSLSAYGVPDAPAGWRLLRHPGLSGMDPTHLRDASARLQQRALHRRYAALARLVQPVGLPGRAEEVAAGLLAFADRLRGTAQHHGIFCSELVAMYFEELGVDLFVPARAPSSVSPNDLDSEACHLKPVADAFVDLGALPENAEVTESEFRFPGRTEWVPPFVENHAQVDRVTTLMAEIRAHVSKGHAAVTLASQASGQAMYEQMVASALRTAADGHAAYADRFSSYAAQVLLLNHLELQVNRRDAKALELATPGPEAAARTQASLHLTRLCLTQRTAVQHRNLRTTLRHALATIRARRRQAGISWRERAMLKRKRQEFVRQYQDARADHRRSIQFVQGLLTPGPLTPEALALVAEIVRDAEVAALIDSGILPEDPV